VWAAIAVPALLTGADSDAKKASAASQEFFESKVRPLLSKNCYGCHTGAKMGGLQMDTLESLMKGGEDGPVVIPGKPDESLLVKAITYTDTPAAWFDVTAFRVPAQYKFGTSGLGVLTGPGWWVSDLSLDKNFQITESKRLVFRWQVFNSFNHNHTGNPDTRIDAPASVAAHITSVQQNMRRMQPCGSGRTAYSSSRSSSSREVPLAARNSGVFWWKRLW
jgi:hypothetical protein